MYLNTKIKNTLVSSNNLCLIWKRIQPELKATCRILYSIPLVKYFGEKEESSIFATRPRTWTSSSSKRRGRECGEREKNNKITTVSGVCRLWNTGCLHTELTNTCSCSNYSQWCQPSRTKVTTAASLAAQTHFPITLGD